jgi:hypothetical protein
VNERLLHTLDPPQVHVILRQVEAAEMDEMWSFVGSKSQIPSDLVVKSQATDIIDLLLQLIRHPNGVHRSCHHRKSRGCGALNICSPVGYH